jgi:hypothetical protein
MSLLMATPAGAREPAKIRLRDNVDPLMKRASLWSLLALLWPALPLVAHAQVALPITEATAGTIRIDGSLREWSGVRFIDVGSGSDASMRVALAYEAGGLYVGAEVRDDRLIRSSSPGANEDAVILTLAMPRGRGFGGTEIYLWAGQVGRSAASIGIAEVGRRPSSVSGAQIVEGPSRGGYTIEAAIPWSAIPGSARWQEGRGTIRLRDVDQSAHPEIEAEPALAPVDAAHLDRLPALQPSGGAGAALAAFLASQGLTGARPAHDLRGDVGEDPRPERVSIVGRFLVVTGDGWQDGRGYSFLQLPVESPGDIHAPRLVDLTGDRKSELTLTLRQRGAEGTRDVWTVMSFAGSQPRGIFAIETRKETSAGTVEAAVRVERGRRREPPTIEARIGAARGLDATTLVEAPATDAEPILVPWGAVRERSYRWDGQRFARIDERPNPDYVDAAARTASAPVSAGTTGRAAASSGPAATIAPATSELLAAFRRERGIASSARPSFTARVNLAATAEVEELAVYGRDLVVVGPAFRGGTGWFHYAIPAHSDADVLDVRTAELTGDPRHEVLIRVRQTIGDVRREVLLVLQFTPTGFPTLLQREVAREQGRDRIENEVRAGSGSLEIRPGTARGWTAASWRFPDGPSGDGIDPPLLPWRDAPITFRLAGGRLVPR